MRLTARRLALIVVAAAVLAFGVGVVMSLVTNARGSGLALGYNGSLLTSIFQLLWLLLLPIAGVLAIRRRPATRPEIVLLLVLAGGVTLMVAAGASETFAMRAGLIGELAVLLVAAFGWVPILGGALGALVVVIVQTIRAPAAEPPQI